MATRVKVRWSDRNISRLRLSQLSRTGACGQTAAVRGSSGPMFREVMNVVGHPE